MTANECPAMESIANGRTSCSRQAALQSVCSFECDEGFELVGAKSVACGQDGAWSAPVPQCRPLSCARQFAPLHGSVDCDSDDGLAGTECRFSCDPSYALLGSEVNKCEQRGPGFAAWSEDAPTCEREYSLYPSDFVWDFRRVVLLSCAALASSEDKNLTSPIGKP
ncbi:MAG: CCP domain-containing protein [Bacteroidota bacterium]